MELNWLILTWVLFPISCLCEVPIGVLNSLIAKTNTPIFEVPTGQLEPILDGLKQYTLFVLISTSNSKYQCSLCEQFDPIFKLHVEDIFDHFGELNNEVAFIRVEATDHLDFLKSLGVKSIPAVWGFPKSVNVYGREMFTELEGIVHDYQTAVSNGDSNYDIDGKLREYSELLEYEKLGQEHYVFDLNQGEPMNEMLPRLEKFISKTVNLDIKPALGKKNNDNSSSLDYTIIIQSFIGFFIVIQLIKKFKNDGKENGKPFWQEKKLYGYLSIVLIYISISGLNFCIQRHSPFISQSKGEIVWIAKGNRQQMGFESILSIGFQILFTFLLIGLVDGVEFFSDEDGSRDLIAMILALGMLAALFVFTFLYGKKDLSYPFTVRF